MTYLRAYTFFSFRFFPVSFTLFIIYTYRRKKNIEPNKKKSLNNFRQYVGSLCPEKNKIVDIWYASVSNLPLLSSIEISVFMHMEACIHISSSSRETFSRQQIMVWTGTKRQLSAPIKEGQS